MVIKAAAAIAAVILTLGLGFFLVIEAQGAPSAVNASTGTTLNPAQSQTVQISFQFEEYSLATPNSIYGLGTAVIYSITQTGVNGAGLLTLAQNQKISASALSSNGHSFTMGATVTVTTTAICAAAGCSGQPMNLTVTTTAQVSTLPMVYLGPTTTTVFSTASAYQHSTALGPGDLTSYDLQLYLPLTVIALGWTVALTVFKPNTYTILLDVVVVVVILGELAAWA